MKLNLLISLTLFFFWGCANHSLDKGFYSPKHPKYSIQLDDEGKKNGMENWWYENGTKKYEANNLHGIREGKFTAWYSDGKPWYEGFESHGRPESTLTYWHPNGQMKSRALFRDGFQLERHDFDEQGNAIDNRGTLALPIPSGIGGMAELDENTSAAARLKKLGLQIWSQRVRQTVESYWILPKYFEKDRPYRAIAKIKVSRDGKILGINWIEKSPSSTFNNYALQTLKRIKRLPAFPPQIKDQDLEVQYEFISLGKRTPRSKLEALDPTDMDATEIQSEDSLPVHAP
jgi:TonB C terminal/MORN repeat variant